MTRLGRVPACADMRQVIDAAEATLTEAGIGSPRADAELLAAHVAGTDRGRLAFTEASPDFEQRYQSLVAQRAKRIPLQHLTGTAAFGPVTVHVGPGVFIPRPETELVAEAAIHFVQPLGAATVVDLCSGSGAIAFAVDDETTGTRVLAVENDPGALAWLRRNALETGVEVVEGDVTDP